MRSIRGLSLLIFVGFVCAAFASPALADKARPAWEKKVKSYKVKIESSPPGAKIYRNGKEYGLVGVTPWEGTLPRNDDSRSGVERHSITVELKGYEPATKTMRVVRPRSRRVVQNLFIPMTKKDSPGKVNVTADADKNAFGASVWVDGQLQGSLPLIITIKEEGRVLVEVKKEGFENFSQWVTVKEETEVTVNPQLKEVVKEVFGSILVTADVNDAEVYIDGNVQTSKTPARFDKISVGAHVVEVRKEPAMPWRQTINVEKDKVVTVQAELKATIGGPGGTLRILADAPGARAYIDGKDVGEVPVDIKGIKPGDHLIEVKAPGYFAAEKRVTVSAGSTEVLKLELQPEASAKTTGTVKVVSPEPEAEVAIDGAVVGPVPQEKELDAGDHFIVVRKVGYADFEKKIRVEPGKEITITAKLRAVGGIKVVTNTPGADVLMDGQVVGQTPYTKADVDVGTYGVIVRRPDHYDFETEVTIEGGKNTTVSTKLEAIDTGPTAEDLLSLQRGLTSFGARTLPLGNSTIDIALGYAHFIEGRITVGAGKLGGMGFDAGVTLRTYFSRSEITVNSRLMFADKQPFSTGAFANIGGGSNFFDDSGRNSFIADIGLMASLTGLENVTVTGRAYLSMWSERHCPEVLADDTFDGDPLQVCTDYKAFVDGNPPADFTQDDKDRVDELIGADDDGDMFNRETGLRAMLSLIIEVAVRQRWNVWLRVEGAPFQGEKASNTTMFSPAMLEEDIGTYIHLGTTYKF
jgi:hypothetical protein